MDTNTPDGGEIQGLSAARVDNDRGLPLHPEVARIAVFDVAIGPGPKDRRPIEASTVAGCESSRCEFPSREPTGQGGAS